MFHLSRVHRTGLWVAVLALVLDQASKAWVVAHPSLAKAVCPHLNVIYVLNRGVTFGLLGGGRPWQLMLIGALTFAIGAWLVVQFKRTTHTFPAVCLGAILGGAAGNLIDRLCRGAVVDFIDFYVHHLRLPFYSREDWHWPTFNIADSFIVLGVIGLFFWMSRKR